MGKTLRSADGLLSFAAGDLKKIVAKVDWASKVEVVGVVAAAVRSVVTTDL